MFNVPAVADFQNYFVRDFPYGNDPSSVMPSDITNAIADAGINFNPAFFADQPSFTLGYLCLTAHYLIMNLRASSQGMAGQYAWLPQSKSVGSVAESFGIPPRILENPYLAMLCKTYYGAKYLSFIIPQLSGQIFTVDGTPNS